ncbi:MAG: hypothetical protein AAFU77_16560 [Myxococcota bacterium]
MTGRALTLFALIAGTACGGVALTTRGALVNLTDESSVSTDCNVIRDLKVKGADAETANVILRNRAGAIDASDVAVVKRTEVPGGVVVEGKAYGCPN